MIKTITVLSLVGLTLLSCEEVISVDDISGDRVGIIAPSQGTVVPSGELNLNWGPIAFADHYQVQVATPDFEHAGQILLDTVTVDTVQGGRHQIKLSLQQGNYEWRVRGTNSAYATGYTSASFSIDTTGERSLDGRMPEKREHLSIGPVKTKE